MIVEDVPLYVPLYGTYKSGSKYEKVKVTLTLYILDDLGYSRVRPIVIICPGGGYNHLSRREGEPVAVRFLQEGYHAAILHYNLGHNCFPECMIGAAKAVSYIREHAREYKIDPHGVVIGGFSAGAHVAASLGCYWNDPLLERNIDLPTSDMTIYRPDALMLCYPVITDKGGYCHKESMELAVGDREEMEGYFSLEDRVRDQVPPTFLWHTVEDESVHMENTLLFMRALELNKIPFECHFFQRGKHGLALANDLSSAPSGEHIENSCAMWPTLFVNWLKETIQHGKEGR